MKNKISIFFLLLLCSRMINAQDMLLNHLGMTFSIPDGFSVIVSSDMGNNMLAFMYGEKKGKKFIAFTDLTNDTAIDYGCPPGQFYTELFSPTGRTKCHERELDILAEGFLKGGVTKVWKSQDATLNYLRFDEEEKTFVYICRADGRTIQIDSDFLTEDVFRGMLSDILGKR
jgi:hypothetical protein